MPELPDVEVFRRYLESTALHQEITGVELESARLLRNVTGPQLEKGLRGRSLAHGHRHGKHLLAELDRGGYLLLHFGMTGELAYYKGADDPDYSQLILRFANNYSLAYVCKRMLGRIGLVKDKDAYVAQQGLGPDAMQLGEGEFRDIINGGRGSIKSTLMNQNRISGLGNIYTDEVLHDAGIRPERTCSDLSDTEIAHLFTSVSSVLQTAIDARARPDEMPSGFLLPNREEGAQCPSCGGTIEKTTISGRSTYFCPSCQE